MPKAWSLIGIFLYTKCLKV